MALSERAKEAILAAAQEMRGEGTATATAGEAGSSQNGAPATSSLAHPTKRAIEDQNDGSPAKRLKTGTTTGTTPIKKVLRMPGMPGPSSSPSSAAPPAASLPPAPPTTDPATTARLKAEYVAALSDEARELLALEIESMGDDWFVALREEFGKGYFRELKKFLAAERKSQKVFPPAQDIYSWSRLCPLAGIRVVIIGQDPYHNDGQAHGLAFSVRKGVQIPPSLRNIYKEAEAELEGFAAPKHGFLNEWAERGVLLLNTSLTVRAHQAGSHSKRGWETFTTAVLRTVAARLKPAPSSSPTPTEAGAHGVVFIAWGAPAAKVCDAIGMTATGSAKAGHLLLKSVHPSPLSAQRGFFGNGHFRKANEWLAERYGEEGKIDWRLTP